MKLALVVDMPGPMLGHKVPVAVPLFTIGRHAKSSLQADDPAIADKHCELVIRDDMVYLRDLGSAGGTYVNDARIAGEMPLQDGDRLRVGPLQFCVSLMGSKPTTKPAPPQPMVKVALVVEIPGPMYGQKIAIGTPSFTIGRDPKSSLQADDPAIAGQHCVIETRGNSVYVRDLGSTTGTLVNQEQVSGEIRVQDGDHLQVGPLLFGMSIKALKQTALTLAGKNQQAKAPSYEENASFAAEKLLHRYFRQKREKKEVVEDDD